MALVQETCTVGQSTCKRNSCKNHYWTSNFEVLRVQTQPLEVFSAGYRVVTCLHSCWWVVGLVGPVPSWASLPRWEQARCCASCQKLRSGCSFQPAPPPPPPPVAKKMHDLYDAVNKLELCIIGGGGGLDLIKKGWGGIGLRGGEGGCRSSPFPGPPPLLLSSRDGGPQQADRGGGGGGGGPEVPGHIYIYLSGTCGFMPTRSVFRGWCLCGLICAR